MRITLLGATFEMARATNEAMHVWLSRCLAEYRGSRTAWDLRATSLALDAAARQYGAWVPQAAAELSVLIPDLATRGSEESAGSRHQREGAGGRSTTSVT